MTKYKDIHNSFIQCLIILASCATFSCRDRTHKIKSNISASLPFHSTTLEMVPEGKPVYEIMVLPKNPAPDKPFRILSVGGKEISEALISIIGTSVRIESEKGKTGEESPFWRIDDFKGIPLGRYKAIMTVNGLALSDLDFDVTQNVKTRSKGLIWKSTHGWDNIMEVFYSAWINALFHGCDERSSWSALHQVTQNKNNNFLYNYLSLGEDDPENKVNIIMQPDCADNPFYLRAYFAWKMSLPFGFHLCDRGSLVHCPKSGQWITNEISTSKDNPVLAFNSFLRMVMNGVHSGTARTALTDDNSDYYPVPLERGSLRPGTVYADPYGHTLVIVTWLKQTDKQAGLLLAVDAQPDGTVAIKRFWKGNFLFNTTGVIGEPGFKAFRPISVREGKANLLNNKELTESSGFIPFSREQGKMKADVFYHTMERLINPKPMDPQSALLDLIKALHEQLLVRVTSVANGEAYMKLHPGTVVPMPSSVAGIFQAGGQWEKFSTPNRDLRLLIAMDAVLDFPDLVSRAPGDYNISKSDSPAVISSKLKSIIDKKTSELDISYIRSDGSLQKLTLADILRRRDAFEMAYNPNDGIEIRWGAPEESEERSTCHRHSPSRQYETMRLAQKWFHKRLHPPT